jgi:dihydroflavonol-4-reductase
MIFVTGATGLVGSHLILSLLLKGQPVRALKRKGSDIERVKKIFNWYTHQAEELFNRIEWVEGDILDYFSIEKALQEVEIIYHCAALISFDNRQKKNIIRNNVEGTANMVNAALNSGVKRFCHLSSISALGSKMNGKTVTEDSSWVSTGKNSVYAVSKFHSETEVWRGVEEGLEAVVVHPSVIIGPGNWKSGSGRFFDMVYSGLPFYTPGITGYVDVRDVVDAMILLTDKINFDKAKNRKFLLSAENLEYRKFLEMIADALHKSGPKFRAGYILLHLAKLTSLVVTAFSGKEVYLSNETISSALRKNYFDGSRISTLFGFRYRPVKEAIRHTSACYLGEATS